MVPGGDSAGSVAPMSAREARTTSSPCHTWGDGGQRGPRPPPKRDTVATKARAVPSTHHGHDGPGAHVLDQAAVEGALAQLRVVLAQQLLGGLQREGSRCGAGPRPAPPPAETDAPLTCTSLSATSLKPLRSKRRITSPTSRLCTPSGFTATKVLSCTPPRAAGPRKPSDGQPARPDPIPPRGPPGTHPRGRGGRRA